MHAKEMRRKKRKLRIRARIFGTQEKPRVSVFCSNKNVYAQAIDDKTGKVVASASSTSGSLKGLSPTKGNAEKIGEALGTQLLAGKVKEAVFDRNGYLYHGVVMALANGIRKTGIRI